MEIADLIDLTEIVLNIATTIGILVAGIWTFINFNVFRSRAENIHIDLLPQIRTKSGINTYILLRVNAQNVGRTKVRNKGCFIAIESLSLDLDNHKFLCSANSPLDLNLAKVYQIFTRHDILEPNEQVSEDIITLVESRTLLRAGVYWIEKNVHWSSVFYIIPDALQENYD